LTDSLPAGWGGVRPTGWNRPTNGGRLDGKGTQKGTVTWSMMTGGMLPPGLFATDAPHRALPAQYIPPLKARATAMGGLVQQTFIRHAAHAG